MPRVTKGAPEGLRKRLSRRIRGWRRYLQYQSEYRRLRPLENLYVGRRAFLVANGPSLGGMNLESLRDEFVCVVNMGLRGVGGEVPRASAHVLFDNNRWRRFADEIERRTAELGIEHRFASWELRKEWTASPFKGPRPHFMIKSGLNIADIGAARHWRRGIPQSPATVLIGAAQVLFFMGFSEVYVLGCDLDYETNGKYFYQMSALDQVHEADPLVQGRRESMILANRDFAILRKHFERHGRRLINSGVGGNLEALERVPFTSLSAPA